MGVSGNRRPSLQILGAELAKFSLLSSTETLSAAAELSDPDLESGTSLPRRLFVLFAKMLAWLEGYADWCVI